jgi:hypothetical protein
MAESEENSLVVLGTVGEHKDKVEKTGVGLGLGASLDSMEFVLVEPFQEIDKSPCYFLHLLNSS